MFCCYGSVRGSAAANPNPNLLSGPQHAAVLFSPTHRQTLHQEEGEPGDSQLPESGHEGAAEQVTPAPQQS